MTPRRPDDFLHYWSTSRQAGAVTQAAAAAASSSTNLSMPAPKRSKTSCAVAVYGPSPTIFQGYAYEMLAHTTQITPNSKFSCRGSSREDILWEVSAPRMKRCLDEFLVSHEAQSVDMDGDTQKMGDEAAVAPTRIIPDPTDMNVLTSLVQFVRKLMYKATEHELVNLMKEKRRQFQIAETEKIALMEWFLDAKQGVCRHHVLVCASMLTMLIERHAQQHSKTYADTNSKVYRYRTTLSRHDGGHHGSHAVIIYETGAGVRYFLDPYYSLAINLTHPADTAMETLWRKYKEFDTERFCAEIKQEYDRLANLRVDNAAAAEASKETITYRR